MTDRRAQAIWLTDRVESWPDLEAELHQLIRDYLADDVRMPLALRAYVSRITLNGSSRPRRYGPRPAFVCQRTLRAIVSAFGSEFERAIARKLAKAHGISAKSSLPWQHVSRVKARLADVRSILASPERLAEARERIADLRSPIIRLAD